MNQQLSITATPKYNFPQPTIDTSFPQRLKELSIRSLKCAQNQPFQLNQQIIQQEHNQRDQIEAAGAKLRLIPLQRNQEETVVAAVDTSSMRIGETSKGLLIAIRGASVWRQERKYRYLRLGPFIFNVTEEIKRGYNALEREHIDFRHLHNQDSTHSLLQMPTRIADLLERWLQAALSSTISDGLILFDGSLTSGVPGISVRRMKSILDNARKMGNVILAFSKITSLRLNGYLITDIPFQCRSPCIFQVTGLKPRPPVALLGDVYVARLGRKSYGFRLDIDKGIPDERRVEAVEKLLGNDLFLQSYPETLRLAHILCTFTANEVIAMQRFITRQYNLKIINRPDMHKLLFGPFGKGESD